MRKIISVIVLIALFVTFIPVASLTVFADEVSIEYNEDTFKYLPLNTFYINGKVYKKYILLKDYKGIAANEHIYVTANDKLVTDRAILEKLVYTDMIRNNASLQSDTQKIIPIANTVDSALPVINSLGNDLVTKTLANSIVTTFKAFAAYLKLNTAEYAKVYAEYVASAGVECSVYLTYVQTLNDLVTDAANKAQKLYDFNNRVSRYVNDRGMTYEEAVEYEDLVRDCVAALKVTEEYLIYLAECVSGSTTVLSLDGAINLLKNTTVEVVKEGGEKVIEAVVKKGATRKFGKELAEKYSTGFVDLVNTCISFCELYSASARSLKIEENRAKYYGEYVMYDRSVTYYVDIDRVVSNVGKLTKTTASTAPSSGTVGSSFDVTETEFAEKMEALSKEYPHLKYWNNANGKVSSGKLKGTSKAGDKKCGCSAYCPATCSCSCGTFAVSGSSVAWQCHGYALLLAYKTFGSNINADSNWEKITSLKKYTFYAGDVVRLSKGHTIFIYKVSGDKIYYTDCNYIGACQINWNGTYSLSKLRADASYVRHYKGNTLLGTSTELFGTSAVEEDTVSPIEDTAVEEPTVPSVGGGADTPVGNTGDPVTEMDKTVDKKPVTVNKLDSAPNNDGTVIRQILPEDSVSVATVVVIAIVAVLSGFGLGLLVKKKDSSSTKRS